MTIAWIGIILMVVILLAVVTYMRRSKPPDTDNPQGPMGRGHADGAPWEYKPRISQLDLNMKKYRNVPGWAEMDAEEINRAIHRITRHD